MVRMSQIIYRMDNEIKIIVSTTITIKKLKVFDINIYVILRNTLVCMIK